MAELKASTGTTPRVLRGVAVPPNPSIERTSKRLRLLAAAHVER
jgi:hypothetical protein